MTTGLFVPRVLVLDRELVLRCKNMINFRFQPSEYISDATGDDPAACRDEIIVR